MVSGESGFRLYRIQMESSVKSVKPVSAVRSKGRAKRLFHSSFHFSFFAGGSVLRLSTACRGPFAQDRRCRFFKVVPRRVLGRSEIQDFLV